MERLLAHSPRWAADPAAASLVEVLIAARDALTRSHDPSGALRALARGDVEFALRTLGPPDRASASVPLRRLADMGDAAVALIPALGGRAAPRDGPFESLGTRYAGIFLLLRAVLDAQLPALIRRSDFPRLDPDRRLPAVLVALAARWAGVDVPPGEVIDPGLALFAGLERPPGLEAGRERCSDLIRNGGEVLSWGAKRGMVDTCSCSGFQTLLLRTLQGRRLVEASTLHLRLVPFAGDLALLGGDASGRVWPLGRVVKGIEDVVPVVEEWLVLWAEVTGAAVESIVCDTSLAEALERSFDVAGGLWSPSPLSERGVRGEGASKPGERRDLPCACVTLTSTPLSQEEREERGPTGTLPHDTLTAALYALGSGRVGVPDADLTLDLTAAALLRLWAVWLKKLAGSSVPYLLENAIRRPGRVVRRGDELEVWLDPAPLDVVLEMSGYLAELEGVPWLGRRVTFRLGRA